MDKPVISKKPSPWQKKQEKVKPTISNFVTSTQELEKCLKYIQNVIELHPIRMADDFADYYKKFFLSGNINTEDGDFDRKVDDFIDHIKLYKKNLILDTWVNSIGREEMLVQVKEMIAKLNYVQHEINTPIEEL